MTMEISMTELRLSDTDVHVALIKSVAVTFGEYEPGCASTIRFESALQDYAGHNMTKR